ncbi:protein SLOW GREEN 1, chloroplastic [Linum grandiflorum]
MDSLNLLNSSRQPPPHFSLAPHRLSFPISSLSFQTLPPSLKLSTVKASSSGAPLHRNPKTSATESLTPFFKATCVTLTAAAALVLSQLHVKPSIASPTAEPATVEPAAEETDSEEKPDVPVEEQERTLGELLQRKPNDIDALRALMDVKIKARKIPEAIALVNRLIALEPNDSEWELIKAQIYTFGGDNASSRKMYEDILQKDPSCVEAYHGLLTARAEDGMSTGDVLRRVEEAMKNCKKDKARDFKLLIGQVRVMEEKYDEALDVYEELVKEEPTDFRPYLCLGIIYTLMRKMDVAAEKFEQFKRLVPKNHPCREFYLKNMFGSSFFTEKGDGEKAWSRS